MTSSFSFKNKVGLMSLAIFASLLASPVAEARKTEVSTHIIIKDEIASQKEYVFLIHKVDDLYHVMLKELYPEDTKKSTKSFSKNEQDDEKFKVRLNTSRKEFKEKNVKLTLPTAPSRNVEFF